MADTIVVPVTSRLVPAWLLVDSHLIYLEVIRPACCCQFLSGTKKQSPLQQLSRSALNAICIDLSNYLIDIPLRPSLLNLTEHAYIVLNNLDCFKRLLILQHYHISLRSKICNLHLCHLLYLHMLKHLVELRPNIRSK